MYGVLGLIKKLGRWFGFIGIVGTDDGGNTAARVCKNNYKKRVDHSSQQFTGSLTITQNLC